MPFELTDGAVMSWILPNEKGKKKGKNKPWREEWLDGKHPGLRGGEK